MTTFPPCLINHAPRTAAEQAPPPSTDSRHDDSLPRADGGLAAADKVPRGRTNILRPDGRVIAESLGRIDWMRPPGPPATPTTHPGDTAMVASNLAPAGTGEQTADTQSSDCLTPFVQLLQRRHGLPPDTATVLSLAALAATVGPGRTLRHPLGGTVSAALNVLVVDDPHAALQRAARQALLPFQQEVEKRIAVHQEKGPKHLRQLRMELDQECARALDWLHSPPNEPPQPLTIPVPREERKREALPGVVEEVRQLANQMGILAFEERPFLVVDGLSAQDLPLIPQRSFDGARLNFSPEGNALRQLETRRPAERQEVSRYLVAAWHNRSYVAGNQATLRPWVTNLWFASAADVARAWRNAALANSGLWETFLIVDNEAAGEVDMDAVAEAAADEIWRTLIDIALGERMTGHVDEYRLSEAATRRFLEFHAHTLERRAGYTRKFVTWWPEQLLKVVLLLHLACLRPEVPEEIDLATLEESITIIERLGAAQLRLVESWASTPDNLEVEVELMVAKIRLSGPLKKRDLFRKYNVQDYGRLEPILARCCDRQQLRLEGDLIYPALPG